MSTGEIRFGVQSNLEPDTDPRAWLDLARRVEDLGFHGLYVADHVGVGASPFSCLAAAAMATSTLRLGTYVLNCGVRDPLALASEAATLDQLSGGRVSLGLGAGHTPAEWTMSGHTYPNAADRVGRLFEMVDVVAALLHGDVVNFRGRYLDLHDAQLSAPRPVQARIPMLIGGNGPALLQYAAQRADVVGLTGLGRTLADGHRHEVRWQPASIDTRVDIVRRAAAERAAQPVLDALVQMVEITDRRDDAAQRCAGMSDSLTAADVVDAPYALVGSVGEIVDEILGHQQRWGITSYVVRADAVDAIGQVIDRLRS